MDIKKVVTVIDAAIKDVDALYDAAVAGGKKDPALLGALRPLAKANVLLEKAKGKLTAAVEAVTPKDKKSDKKADKK